MSLTFIRNKVCSLFMFRVLHLFHIPILIWLVDPGHQIFRRKGHPAQARLWLKDPVDSSAIALLWFILLLMIGIVRGLADCWKVLVHQLCHGHSPGFDLGVALKNESIVSSKLWSRSPLDSSAQGFGEVRRSPVTAKDSREIPRRKVLGKSGEFLGERVSGSTKEVADRPSLINWCRSTITTGCLMGGTEKKWLRWHSHGATVNCTKMREAGEKFNRQVKQQWLRNNQVLWKFLCSAMDCFCVHVCWLWMISG